jgi:CHRD domain-containing protein
MEHTMNRSSVLSGVLAAVLATILVPAATADPPITAGQTKIAADLTGYEETPLTINSAATGELEATISKDGKEIAYTLTYSGFLSPVTQAHIHFGRPAITGMIVLFLCTNLTPLPSGVPAPPPCPTPSGTVSGTLTAADVIARSAQGIDAGQTGFDEMLKAIRAGAAYVNVHTMTFPGGEIRSVLHTDGPGGE